VSLTTDKAIFVIGIVIVIIIITFVYICANNILTNQPGGRAEKKAAGKNKIEIKIATIAIV
jgi:hypothetical protein